MLSLRSGPLEETAVARIVFSPNDSQRSRVIQRISTKEHGDHSGKDSTCIDAIFGRALHLLSTLLSDGIITRVILGEVPEEQQPPHWGYIRSELMERRPDRPGDPASPVIASAVFRQHMAIP